MFFADYVSGGYLDPFEYKFLVCYFLREKGRMQNYDWLMGLSTKEFQQLLDSFKCEPQQRTQEFLRYLQEKKVLTNRQDLNQSVTYVTNFCLHNTKNDIAMGFLYTPLRVDMISGRLKSLYRGTYIDTLKVNQVLDLFKEVAYVEYSKCFSNQGDPRKYLGHAFNEYFRKKKATEISAIVNDQSIYNAEGVDKNSYLDRSDFREKEHTLKVRNFLGIVRDVYARSKALGYKIKDPNDVVGAGAYQLLYDLFSCIKYLRVRQRFAEMRDSYKKSFDMTWDSMFEIYDKNNVGYAAGEDGEISAHSFNYRNYTSRLRFVEELLDQQYNATDYEFLRAMFNSAIEGSEKHNNTKVFKRTPESWDQDVATFKTLKHGIKSVMGFVRELERKRIDPLAIPSDIFRDPTWLQRVKDLEDYVTVYQNVQEISSSCEVFEKYDLAPNERLTALIAQSCKEEIAKLPIHQMKSVLAKKAKARDKMFIMAHNKATAVDRGSFMRMATTNLNRLVSSHEEFLIALYKFSYILNVLYGENVVAEMYPDVESKTMREFYAFEDNRYQDIREGNLSVSHMELSKLKNSIERREEVSYIHYAIFDWMPPNPKLEEYVENAINSLEGKPEYQVVRECLIAVRDSVNEIADPKPFEDRFLNLFREASMGYFVAKVLSGIFSTLSQLTLNDIIFYDTIKIAEDFIESGASGFRKFTDLHDLDCERVCRQYHLFSREIPSPSDEEHMQATSIWEEKHPYHYLHPTVLTCLQKNAYNNDSVTNEVMKPTCKKVYDRFKVFFDYLKCCLDIIQADDRYPEDDKPSLGFYERELMSYSLMLAIYPDVIRKAKGNGTGYKARPGDVLYKDAYYMRKNEPVTFKENGVVYYVHKSGVGVNPKVDFTSPNAIRCEVRYV